MNETVDSNPKVHWDAIDTDKPFSEDRVGEQEMVFCPQLKKQTALKLKSQDILFNF